MAKSTFYLLLLLIRDYEPLIYTVYIYIDSIYREYITQYITQYIDQMPPKQRIPPEKQTSEQAREKCISSLVSRDDDIQRGPTVSWGIVGLPVESLSREESRMCDQHMISTRKRELVNSARATQECKPYIEDGIRDRRRISELKNEIVQIGLQLEKLSIPLKDRRCLVSSIVRRYCYKA